MKDETDYQVYLNAFGRTKTGANQHAYINSGVRNNERHEVANALGICAAIATGLLLTKTDLAVKIDELLK